jgi:hypothetical protein
MLTPGLLSWPGKEVPARVKTLGDRVMAASVRETENHGVTGWIPVLGTM